MIRLAKHTISNSFTLGLTLQHGSTHNYYASNSFTILVPPQKKNFLFETQPSLNNSLYNILKMQDFVLFYLVLYFPISIVFFTLFTPLEFLFLLPSNYLWIVLTFQFS